MVRSKRLWAIALLLGLTAGCCDHPEIFQKVSASLETVQGFYDPLVQDLGLNEEVRQAVVAADTTLLLAGELQRQWCLEPGQAAQLELQTGEAQKMAQQAGVTATAAASPKEQGK